jgi:hypothetical protein
MDAYLRSFEDMEDKRRVINRKGREMMDDLFSSPFIIILMNF